MKINGSTRFPHPILWAESNDYVDSRFDVNFKLAESTRSGQLVIEYSADLCQPIIQSLLDAGEAAAGIFITCGETYYNTLAPITLPAGSLTIGGGQLRGRVVMRPMIWTLRRLDSFEPAAKHPEYGQGRLAVEKSALLAIADEVVIDVGNEKLARIESIFSLNQMEVVPEGMFQVQLDGEKIRICSSGKTFEQMHRLRAVARGRAILLNAVYMPVVMSVLEALREESGAFEGKRWHRIFNAKLTHLGINIESADALQAAQKIFEAPFGRMTFDVGGASL